MLLLLMLCTSLALSLAHQQPFGGLEPEIDISNEPWTLKYGAQRDLTYSGILSFSHLPYSRCLEDATHTFDIAVLGFPFDTTTTFRPGTRFGPFAIRAGSRRQSTRGYTLSWGGNPDALGAMMIDCGDAPISPFDNAKALDQMEAAYSTLLARRAHGGTGPAYKSRTAAFAKDGVEHPRIVTLGGDHTIVLPILRALHKVYGPVSVIHFDAHLDTANVSGNAQDQITHGSYFTIAAKEHLMSNTSIHGGIRSKILGVQTIEHDEEVGFQIISADDIDDYGINRVIKAIRDRVGSGPVYLSLDIDVVDPGLAPATGTPEAGGWSTREVKRILRGLTGLNFVGADIVEVAPAYDQADITGIAAADIVHDFLIMLQMDEPPRPHIGPFSKEDLLKWF